MPPTRETFSKLSMESLFLLDQVPGLKKEADACILAHIESLREPEKSTFIDCLKEENPAMYKRYYI
jgi:hypothetical protein